MRKKKHLRRILIAVLILLLLVPIHVRMTDGGSEGWHAGLWQLTRVHELTDQGMLTGTRVMLLFGLIPVFDNTAIEP